MKKSQTSAVEIEMKQLLNEAHDIVEGSYLKTEEARRILDLGQRMLMKCEELRISRDNRIQKQKVEKLMLESFKFGQEKYEAENYSIKLWVQEEIEKIKIIDGKKYKLIEDTNCEGDEK